MHALYFHPINSGKGQLMLLLLLLAAADPCAGASNVGSLRVLFQTTFEPTLTAVNDSWTKSAGDTHALDVLANDVINGVKGVTIADVTRLTGVGGSMRFSRLQGRVRTLWFRAPDTTGTFTFSYTISGTNNVTGVVMASTAFLTLRTQPVCPSLRHLGCVAGEAGQLQIRADDTSGCPIGNVCVQSSAKAGIRCTYALRPAGFVCRQAPACGPCGRIPLSCDGASPACPSFEAVATGPIAKVVVKKAPGAAKTEALMCSHNSSNWPAPPSLSRPTGQPEEEDWINFKLPKPAPDGSTWEYYVRGCNSDAATSGCDTSKVYEQCRVGHFEVFRARTAEHCSDEGAERVVELSCVYRKTDNTCWWSCKQ